MKKREESYEDTDDAKNLIAAAKRETADYNRSQISDEPGATEPLRAAAVRMGASKPKSIVSGKAPVITKEQMKKAGFDNLRDYMNAQKGLTRRGERSKQPSPQDIDRLEAASTAAGMRADREKYMKEKSMDRVRGGMKSGGKVSSASKRADGIAIRGKTRA